MMSQYIYLLKEREFIKTKEHIYKVGMTKKENHERFNQYPKGSVLLFQMICNNCKNMEKLVLTKFKETFKQRKDIGNEYFEGEYKSMIDIIYLTINDEEKTITNEEDGEKDDDEDEDKDEDDEEEKENKIKFNLLCEKICKTFPDYKDDVSFGGNKKYIKISIIDDEYVVLYINPKLMDYLDHYYETECEIMLGNYIFNHYEISKYVADDLQYFNHLISTKLVSLDKIYDILSTDFITKINKTKFDIKIENYDDLEIHLTNNNVYSKIGEKIWQLFHCNTIINNCLYSTMAAKDKTYNIFKKIKKIKNIKNLFDNFTIDVGLYDYKPIQLYKINSKYYDYETCLRKYIPYVIQWDINNNYYIVNRDYEYIGLNCHSIDYSRGGLRYLFKDGNKPWSNMNNYIGVCNEYKKIIKDNSLKECLNTHNSTTNMLTLFD